MIINKVKGKHELKRLVHTVIISIYNLNKSVKRFNPKMYTCTIFYILSYPRSFV